MEELLKTIPEPKEDGWDASALKNMKQDYGHINFTPTKHKRIVIIGHMANGKDTVAEMIKKHFGYTFKSSSIAASEIFLFDKLKAKYGYKTPEECFEDRVNHRAEWHDEICEYNREDAARLAKDIMKDNDIYVGMRSNRECISCMIDRVFDIVIGVYDPRKPLEPKSSFDIDLFAMSDIIIPNAGSLEDLESKVKKLKSLLK
jgi:hypothetical protein